MEVLLLDLREQPACTRLERPPQLRVVHVLCVAARCARKVELISERREFHFVHAFDIIVKSMLYISILYRVCEQQAALPRHAVK